MNTNIEEFKENLIGEANSHLLDMKKSLHFTGLAMDVNIQTTAGFMFPVLFNLEQMATDEQKAEAMRIAQNKAFERFLKDGKKHRVRYKYWLKRVVFSKEYPCDIIQS